MQRQQGQSLVEAVILLPLFLAILAGIFEFTYIYRAKATLNTATFEAARAGSLNNAQVTNMREALTSAMLPLYVKGNKSISGLSKGYVLVTGAEQLMSLKRSTVIIVSPTKNIYDAFKVKRYYKPESGGKEIRRWIMPNDNLNVRSTATKTIKVDGKNQKISIQDANLLKIKTYWCYELKVPVLKTLIHEIISGGLLWSGVSDEQKTCNLGSIFGEGKYMAITSHAIVRMQSPVIM